MNVAGIDISTRHIDLVLLDMDTDKATWDRYELGAGDLLDRIRRVRRYWFGSYLLQDVVAYGVERPLGRHGAWQVSLALGGVLQCIPPHALVEWFQPNEWRVACGLKGNASKDDVTTWVRSREITNVTDGDVPGLGPCKITTVVPLGGLHDWPQDACDAYCIAYATRKAIEITTAKEAAI